jgi:hypothetical protein
MAHKLTAPHKLMLLAAATTVLASLGVASTASGAADTTPPVWTQPPTNAITLGARLDPALLQDCDSWYLPVKISWAAQDSESGIDHYGYSGYDLGSEDATITSNTSLNTLLSWVIDDICGGGGSEENFYAWNGAGQHIAWRWSDQGLGVVQDDRFDGSTCDIDGGGYDCLTHRTYMTYNGTWGTSAANAFSGGTTHKTTQSGASATLHINSNPYGGADYGVGLLMAKGTDRGKAAIFVDGVKVTTIDTKAASKVNRTVVWRQTMSGDDWHTVNVVNLATPGRTRIDVDAFVLIRKQSGFPLDPTLY